MRKSTKAGISMGVFTAMTGGIAMIPMAVVGLALCYKARQREDMETPQALSNDFIKMYNNNPGVREYTDRIMKGRA